jgi:glyoxylase I family protein
LAYEKDVLRQSARYRPENTEKQDDDVQRGRFKSWKSEGNHFFFDIGNHNLLGFFDFPGYDLPPFSETIGGVQHLAISISVDQFDAARKKLEQAGVDYLGPDRGADDSMYFRDPNGIGLELYREKLGVFEGERLLDY